MARAMTLRNVLQIAGRLGRQWPLAALLWLGSCQRASHQESREIGYEGKARTQPFLALTRMLDDLGYETEVLHGLGTLPRQGTLVVSAEATRKPSSAAQVLDWVTKRHGHLILLLQGTENWQDDWGGSLRDIFAGADGFKLHPILAKLGLTVEPHGLLGFGHGKDLETEFQEETLHLQDQGGTTLDSAKLTTPVSLRFGTPEASLLLSTPWKGGRVTVIGNATPWRNRYVDLADHARIFVRLLQQESDSYEPGAHVCFLFTSAEGFFSLLWNRYWMALCALVVLIAGWLWKNLPRFGPLTPLGTTELRQFTEHLHMSGNFLFNHGQTMELLQPIRAAICQCLYQRHGFHEHTAESAIVTHLAAASQLPIERVSAAWNASYVKDPRHFLTYLQDLQTIRLSL